jgi:hypothetical protein
LKPASKSTSRNRINDISRREFLKATAVSALGAAMPASAIDTPRATSTLYNGIRLAQPWPPNRKAFTDPVLDPPYLVDPPAVIPIDVGRQLFVDDFLIEETSLARTFHRATYHSASPVLRPTTAWERRDEYAERTKTRSNPAAMVFSDGVFYDPESRLFKMWYMGGYQQNTCYAFSHDGLSWEKPALDIIRGTNIVTHTLRDSSTVWLDPTDPDRAKRYKLAFYNGGHGSSEVYVSADGIHWQFVGDSGMSGDRSTFFYNPFRNVWVFSLRDNATGSSGRFRRYWESSNFVEGAKWRDGQPVRWVAADSADPRRPEYNVAAEIYNLDCVAYESLVLGLFTIYRGERDAREKPNDICLGYSRDGFHWARPDRTAFIGVSENVGDWNWANVQSAGGCCLVLGDTLYFYVSGRQGVPGTNLPGICSTGLATLRRDGFASMNDAPARVQRIGSDRIPGTLTTRPIRFTGRHLFVNADVPRGEIRVDVLSREGRPIEPYQASRCIPFRGNSTRAAISWSGAPDLKAVAGDVVRFRFHVSGGQLYSFWVSPTAAGASNGYVAAGGPGLTDIIDKG